MSRSLDCSLDYARDDIARDDKRAGSPAGTIWMTLCGSAQDDNKMSRSLDCSLDYARDDIARDDNEALHDAVNKKRRPNQLLRSIRSPV